MEDLGYSLDAFKLVGNVYIKSSTSLCGSHLTLTHASKSFVEPSTGKPIVNVFAILKTNPKKTTHETRSQGILS